MKMYIFVKVNLKWKRAVCVCGGGGGGGGGLMAKTSKNMGLEVVMSRQAFVEVSLRV